VLDGRVGERFVDVLINVCEKSFYIFEIKKLLDEWKVMNRLSSGDEC
jgi:hypothetical protein